MNLLRPLTVGLTLIAGSAFAGHHHHGHHHHSSHHSGGGSGGESPDVCLKWADVPVDAGVDAGSPPATVVPEVDAGASDVDDGGVDVDDGGVDLDDGDGGIEADDGGVEPEGSDAGTVARVATVRVCVEHLKLGCSTSGPVSGGLLALMVLISRRRKA